MRKGFLRMIVAVCFLAAAGCTHLDGYLDIAREKGMSAEYRAALGKWTRSQTVYSQFETRVHISATFRSPQFREAQLKEYARLYQLSGAEQKKREDLQEAAAGDLAEFLFYAYLPEKAHNDFDRRGSIWSVFLSGQNGERIEPVEVRRIDPVTPLVTEFFPYVNPHYGVAYHLRFPASAVAKAGADPMKLIFAGVVGKVVLEFGGR